MIERVLAGMLLLAATMSVFSPWAGRLLNHARAVQALSWLFAISRIAAWLGCYVLIPGLVRSSDLVKYYYPEALNAVQGQVPYVDFASSYGPLFPYLAGALLPVWQSPAAIALILVACEVLAVFALCSIVRKTQSADPRGPSDPTLARALFIYALNPAAVYWSGMIAYNSSVILLFWVLAIGLLFAQRYGSSLVALSASVVFGKALGILAAPLWLADPRRRIKYVILAAVIASLVFLVARQFDIDLLLPLQREGDRSTSGNVWFLLSGVLALSPESTLWRLAPLATFALSVGAFMTWLWSRWKQPPSFAQFCGAVAALGWLFMLLSKKTYPHYTPMFLLFCVLALCASRPKGAWILLLALVGAIGIIEPGLWNALGQPAMLSDACTKACDPGTYYALIACDVALVSIEAYLVASCMRFACQPSTKPA